MSKRTDLYRATLERDRLMSNVLKASGELATVARALAGGRDFTTGARLSSVRLVDVSTAVVRLRKAVDAYDDAIILLQESNRADRTQDTTKE